MITAAKIDEKKYGRLLAKSVPRVPENDTEYEELLAQIEELMEMDESELSIEQTKLLTLLSVLVEQYEDKNHPIGNADPIEVLRDLMEQRSLKPKDIWDLFGSKGIASEVLNGKRSISKAHARRLAQFFHVSINVFI
jgi:HTH-type transcriptional regulator / antitoxin HigA